MTDERTAAMDALIADSADMIDAPASADAMGEVERVAKALAGADGLDWDEVCGVDADPDEGCCDSGTCVAAHWEEHDAEQARRWYMHLATAATAAMSPAGEVERAGIVEHAIRALEQIAGSHWERFGIDQTDVEQIPDLSAGEAMNLARETLMDITERSVTPLPSPPATQRKDAGK